jgi:hypothetical protein
VRDSNMTLPDARRRFSQVAATLAQAPYAGAIRIGFAGLGPADSAAGLIARADGGLSDSRKRPPRQPIRAARRHESQRKTEKGSNVIVELALRAGLQPKARKPPKRTRAEARSLRHMIETRGASH